MQPEQGKFCPACKLLNDLYAEKCVHCGFPFEDVRDKDGKRVNGKTDYLTPEEESEIVYSPHTPPEYGLAFFFPETVNPFEVRTDAEFLIGRKTDDSPERIVDLANYDAFGHGVSRRHVKIRRVDDKYEILDLDSTNGTWINEKRLAPNKSYPLASGDLIRLGRMRLFVAYK
jgi:hypothetical protein